MDKKSAKNSVYFSALDTYLKDHAQSQPEGFSAYIKRLIRQDMEKDYTDIQAALQNVLKSKETEDLLTTILSKNLADKVVNIVSQSGEEETVKESLSNDEASVLLSLCRF